MSINGLPILHLSGKFWISYLTYKPAFGFINYFQLNLTNMQLHVHNSLMIYREDVAEYCTSIRALVLRLLETISESLGLEKNYVSGVLGKHGQHMAMNYYPPCPQPELTYGLPGHTDCSLITVLLQDDVPGLQVLRNGKWVSVNPIPNSFIVNIGDHMQVNSDLDSSTILKINKAPPAKMRKIAFEKFKQFLKRVEPISYLFLSFSENVRPCESGNQQWSIQERAASSCGELQQGSNLHPNFLLPITRCCNRPFPRTSRRWSPSCL